MNIRKVWMAILIALSFGLLMSAASAQTVIIADGSADAGTTTTVTLTADGVTDLANFDITVTYNPAVVNVTDAVNNPAFDVPVNNLENAADGWVRIAGFNIGSAGQTGDGILLSTLTLEAVGTSGQTSALALTINELADSSGGGITAVTDHGVFTVVGEPPASIVSICDGSAAADAATTVTITADGVTDLSLFDVNVTYNPAVVNVTYAANNPAFDVPVKNLDNAADGWVRIAGFNIGSAGQTGDGILLSTLTLEAVGTSGQTSALALTINELKDSTEGDITAITKDGLFAVGAAAADTTPPVANAGQDQTVDVLTVYFDGSGSSDNFGIVSYEWDFGDGTVPAMGETTNHTYPMVGLYTVTLTVCDAAGNKDTDVATVTVNAPEDSKTLPGNTSFTLESGNANVTGNFSVGVVSGDVAVQAVGNVTAHVPDATTVGLGAGYELISGAIVNVSDDIHEALNRSNGTVTIELCVSDSILSAMGLTRSNVQIYVYNDGKWIGLTTTRVGTTDCHTADISGYLSEVTVGIGSKSAPTPYHRTGGGGGGGATYPPSWYATPTPTVTATVAPTAPPGATPGVTPVATPVEMVETPPAEVEVETPAPTPKPPKTGVPGFTSVFAIAGLLAALYLVLQRRE